MANLNKIPLIDWFETTLSQPWNGWLGTVNLNDTPAFTFPSGVTTYIVVNPGRSNMQVAEIDSKGVGTVNVSNITVEKWAWVNYTAQTHLAGSTVIISDNYQFWKDIRTAINTKLDQDWGNWLSYANEAARDAALGGDWVATEWYRNIFVQSTNLYYNYNLWLAQWQSIDTGTSPWNATESAPWLVELATSWEATAGTDTSSGNPLVVKPSQLKAVADSISTNATPIKDKVDVVVATTANITLSGTQTIDWVAVTAWQRVLVKDQTAWAENGIYLCAAGSWTRATDFDANANNEVDLWASIWVQWGTVNAWTQWVLSTTGTITVGTTALVFIKKYPFVDVWAKATQSTGTTWSFGAYFVLTFNTEEYDTHSFHNNSTNNSRLTIPTGQTWTYIVVARVWNSANYKNLKITKNGSTDLAKDGQWSASSPSGTDAWCFTLSWVGRLSAWDYVEAFCYSSSNTVTTTADTDFTIQRIA